MSNFIPLSIPQLDGNEWKYIKECLDTNWVSTAGQYVTAFEERIAEYTGAEHAVACVNGTSALQVTLRLAGVKADDEVIVPTLTFIAPINAVHYLHAHPVFMDADQYYNLDAGKLRRFLEDETISRDGQIINKSTGRRIAAVMPVHVFGNAADLETLMLLCDEYGLAVIEDATESLGTTFKAGTLDGQHCGTIGMFGCLSFNGNKIITTGGGGMILTNDGTLAERAKYLTTQAKDDTLYYLHNDVGYNFRLTNIQAAMGVAQLEQLTDFIQCKRRIYTNYLAAVHDIPGLTMAPEPPYCSSNCWMPAIQVDRDVYPRNTRQLIEVFKEARIETRPVWHLNHLQLPYSGAQSYDIENAVQLAESSLCLPCSTGLTIEEQERIIGVLADV